jgi:hypothetical protein
VDAKENAIEKMKWRVVADLPLVTGVVVRSRRSFKYQWRSDLASNVVLVLWIMLHLAVVAFEVSLSPHHEGRENVSG